MRRVVSSDPKMICQNGKSPQLKKKLSSKKLKANFL